MNARGDLAIVWQGSANLNADPDAGKVEAVTAASGQAFSPVQRLASGRVRRPQLALGHDGRAAVAWKTANYKELPLAIGAVPGGFGPATSVFAENASVTAVGPGGHAIAVWTNRTRDRDIATQLLASYRQPGGGFGPVLVLAEQASVDSYMQVVPAIDEHGMATVVWRGFQVSGEPLRLWTVTVSPAGQPSAPAALSTPGQDVRTGEVRLVANARGDVAASWLETTPSGQMFAFDGRPRVAVRQVGRTWGPAEVLAEPDPVQGPVEIALDHAGALVATWSGFSPNRNTPGASHVLRVQRRQPGGPLGSAAEIKVPRPPIYPRSQRAGLDGHGTAVVAWNEGGEERILRAATQRPGQQFGAPITLGTKAEPYFAVFDASDSGVLVVRDWTNQGVAAYGYLGRRAQDPSPYPLAGVRVAADRRTVRFRAREPGRVDSILERAVRRRGYRTVSILRRRVRRGPRRIPLTAATRRPLARGNYRLTLRAYDPRGWRLGQRRLRFSVVR